MNLLIAFIFRDLAIEKNYRFNIFLKSLAVLFQLAIFYFLSSYLGKAEYFSFVLTGLLFSRFFQFWLNVFSENIRQEQYWGTAESVFLSPRPQTELIFASVTGKFLLVLVELILIVIAGKYVFGAQFSINSWVVLPVIIINGLAFAGLGLISGSFIMYFKRGDPVNWLISSSFDLLSGVYFSLSVLPESIRIISNILPTTSALRSWRDIFLYNNPVHFWDIVSQSIWAVVLIIAGIAVFKKSVKLAKQKGELGTY